MLKRLISACVMAVLTVVGVAASAQTPTPARDELLSLQRVTLEAAEAWMAEALSRNSAIQDYDIVGPGHFEATTASGETLTLYLDNLMARIDVPPKERAGELAIYEANLIDMIDRMENAAEPDPSNVLPIVRHQEFLAAFPADMPPEASPVSRPLGDSAIILAYDSPTGIGVASKLSMGIENLTDDQAFAFAISNFEQFAKGRSWAEGGGLRFALLDDNYESSLILLEGVWEELEAGLGGPVAIAIPARNMLAAGRADDPEAIALLRYMIEAAMDDPYRVSEDVFVRRNGDLAVLEP